MFSRILNFFRKEQRKYVRYPDPPPEYWEELQASVRRDREFVENHIDAVFAEWDEHSETISDADILAWLDESCEYADNPSHLPYEPACGF